MSVETDTDDWLTDRDKRQTRAIAIAIAIPIGIISFVVCGKLMDWLITLIRSRA